MSIQDRLNSCLQSMNIDPINDDQKTDESMEDLRNLEIDKSIKDLRNLETDNSMEDLRNQKTDESEDNNLIDLKSVESQEDDLQNIFDLNFSIFQKIKLDEMINLEVKKRIELHYELSTKLIKKKFKSKENELYKKEKSIEETKKELDEKLKFTKEMKIKYQLKEQEILRESSKLKEAQIKLKKDQEEIEFNINNEKQILKHEFKKLIKLKRYFENESDNKYIKLNVGGTIFETTLNLLKDHSEYFKGLLSGKFRVLKDSNDIIFVDRCPELFKEIMKIIRDLDRGNEIDIKITERLNKELDYYLINF